jgi:glutamate racemase
MPHRPIGIFDSGLGGISVLKEIHKQMPSEDLIYIADSANAPYGDKDAHAILQRSQIVTEFLIKQNIKALVIACNTATAVAAEILRKQFPDIDIIGLEPAVKPAAELTKTGVIGILATEQTIRSKRLQGLIENHAKDKITKKQACPGLVEQVEKGEFSSKHTVGLLDRYITPMLEQGMDTLVLGCTHYPFLIDAIHQLSDHRLTILETSIPVTQQLQRLLVANVLKQKNRQGEVYFFSSESCQKHQNGMRVLWGGDIQIERLPEGFC